MRRMAHVFAAVVVTSGAVVGCGDDDDLADPVLKNCAAGFYSPSGKQPCSPSPVGSFVDDVGATEPTLARPGHFVGQTSAVFETPCSPGTYQDQRGQMLCKLAPPGFFVPDEGAVSPTPCPAGTATKSVGAVDANECHPAA